MEMADRVSLRRCDRAREQGGGREETASLTTSLRVGSPQEQEREMKTERNKRWEGFVYKGMVGYRYLEIQISGERREGR